MAYNGSGVFSPLAAPTFPAVAGQTISSEYFNAIINDILNNGLGQVLTRDGQGKPSAHIDWNGYNLTNVEDLGVDGVISAALGAAATPSYSFTGDLNTGMWSPTADAIAWSAGGFKLAQLTKNAFDGALFDAYDSSGAQKIRLDAGGGVAVQDGLYVRCYNPAATRYGELKSDASGVILQAASAGDTLTFATNNQAFIWTINGITRLTLGSSGILYNVGAYNSTTSNAANMYVGADGSFNRSTSSLRFKEVLEPLSDEWAYKLLELEAIFYKSKCPGDNPDWTHTGFGAEDVARVNPRWVLWRTTDDEGNPLDEPVADGVHYGQLVTELQHIAKCEKARADNLEARLEALEVRLMEAGL